MKTLVVDTCSLLDLVRAPIRPAIPGGQILHALEIQRAFRVTPQAVRVVVCDWVEGEYRRGVEGVAQDVRQQLKSMWNSHRQATDVMAVHRGQPADVMDADVWIEAIIAHGKRVAESLIAVPLVSATTDDERLGAQRTRMARAPSHKGKGSLADAVVTEVALRIARDTVDDADGKPVVVLLSANTNDFCDGKRLKPELQSEFDAVGLGFASNWTVARYACLPVNFS